MADSAPTVLIVGAGPTGLTLACELARYGVDFRLVDRAAGPSTYSKALAVHARTLELLTAMGIVDRFLDAGRRLHEATLYAEGRRLAHLSLDELDSPYPFVVSLPQAQTEALLLERLAELGHGVEWSVEMTGLIQDDGGVEAALLHADGGVEAVHPVWVAGCDGAHSAVRRTLGLSFEGEAMEQTFLLADVRLTSELSEDGMHTFFSEGGIVGVIPMPGSHTRVVVNVPEARREMPEPTLAAVRERAERRGLEGTMEDPVWVSGFRVHTRMATAFRVERVFLAGDAAHIHSPVGGQGMNTGMQDAYNLAWKLALVARGRGRGVLLDSYDAERRPIARALLQGTERSTRVATLRHPVAQGIRNVVAEYLTTFEVIQQRLVRAIAMIDLHYQRSPIVDEHRAGFGETRLRASDDTEAPSVGQWREFARGPQAGERAPDGVAHLPGADAPTTLFGLLSGLHHTLLLFDGYAPTPEGYRTLEQIGRAVLDRYEGLVDVCIVVPRETPPPELDWAGLVLLDTEGDLLHRYGAAAECAYLIRPDGYVGFRTQPADDQALSAYLDRIFR